MDITQIIKSMESGNPQAANQLLPLVYEELRSLASKKLAHEKPGQTLQPTALVHEAYLRLIGPANEQGFANRIHFFSAAAESMRRILVEKARHKKRVKRGGGGQAVELQEHFAINDDKVDELLSLHEVIDQLVAHDEQAGTLVKLRFFAGLEHQEAADIMGISRRAADRLWLLARTWLVRTLKEDSK